MSVVRTVITTVLLCIAVAGVHAQSLRQFRYAFNDDSVLLSGGF